jgi:hypothetical protein
VNSTILTRVTEPHGIRFGQIITQRADGPALEVFTPLGAAQAVAFNTEDNLIE